MLSLPLPSDDLAFVIANTKSDWEALRGKNLFITGGTGFFGVWLLESFARANEELALGAMSVVLTRDAAGFARRCPHLAGRHDIILHTGDVRDFGFPSGAFPFVIHAATDTTARSSLADPFDGFNSILDGTRHVLDFAAQADTARFLFVSSGAVYGSQPADLPGLTETYPGAPDTHVAGSFYGEAKRAAEFLCAAHARSHGYVMNTARCFAFVGPHLPLDGPYAIGNFLRDAIAGSAIHMAGDGTAIRSYLYAADLSVWLWRILFGGSGDLAYNVGSEETVTIRELAALIATTFDSPDTAPICGLSPSSSAASRYVPDTRRARTELNLHAWTPLPAAIRKTAAWLNTPACPSNAT